MNPQPATLFFRRPDRFRCRGRTGNGKTAGRKRPDNQRLSVARLRFRAARRCDEIHAHRQLFFGTFAFFEKQFGSLLYFSGVSGNELGHNRFVCLLSPATRNSPSPSLNGPLNSIPLTVSLPGSGFQVSGRTKLPARWRHFCISRFSGWLPGKTLYQTMN